MERAKERLQQLIKEGEVFTWGSIGRKSSHGNLTDLTPEWTDWTIRVDALIINLFGERSYVYTQLHSALTIRMIGYPDQSFQRVKLQIIGSLQAAEKMVDDFPRQKDAATAPGILSNRVFIVHGHDHKAKGELEMFLTEIGLDPIVLHRQPDEGKTIIEKFEKHSDVGYAFILLTPDDVMYSASQETVPDENRNKHRCARPNVIFEFGYFVGRLGRENVCCLHTGNVALPSDVHGILYKSFGDNVEEVGYAITKELKARGYQLK